MDVVSTVEIAQMLGLSRQRVDKLSRGDNFPEPLAELAIGRIWLRDEIAQWAARTGRTSSATRPASHARQPTASGRVSARSRRSTHAS